MFPFWAQQPVFHVYDLPYYFMKPGVIEEKKTSVSKWVNHKNMLSVSSVEANKPYQKEMTKLIAAHYLRNKSLEYIPKDENIEPYINTRDVLVLHYYYADRMIGTITLRSVNMTISGHSPPVQYVDFLCVHKDHRKKGIAQELIATLYHEQRRKSYYKVSLFKNEGMQRGIIPLCIYRSYRLSLRDYVMMKLAPPYGLEELTDKTFHTMYPILKYIVNEFECSVSMDMCHMLLLLSTKNILIYKLQYRNKVLAVYFVRNTNCYHGGREVKELYCSYKTVDCSNELFVLGCGQMMGEIKKNCDEIIIENIGHSRWLVDEFRSLVTSSYITGYYLYNYIHKTVSPSRVYINL